MNARGENRVSTSISTIRFCFGVIPLYGMATLYQQAIDAFLRR
jgi:hypothetical protein